MRVAARASWRTRCEHSRLVHSSWSRMRHLSSGAGGGDSALLSAVLGVDSTVEDHPWIRRPLESIPSPSDASAMQDGDAKLSKRQLAELVHSVTKLHALQSVRSASQYNAEAQLRVRRMDRPESCYELLPYFWRLQRWLHASQPVSTGNSPLNLRRLRVDGGATAGSADEDKPSTSPQASNRRRGGTAEDPRRRREIAAAKQAQGAAEQQASKQADQGQRVGKGPTGISTPVARRRRIQEMSSKPTWEHKPAWEGWLSVQQTYGLRVKYPTLRLAIPVIKINRGVVGAIQVDSRIHVTLSADGTVLSQLWEHNGGLVFSAILAFANRGQSIPQGNGAAGGGHEVEAEAQAATTQIRMLLGLGSFGVLGILAAQLGHTSGF